MSHKLSFYQESIQLPIATRLALLAEGVSKRSVVPISLIQGALKRLQAWRDNYPRLRKTTVGRNLSPVTFGLDAVESVQAKMVASGTKALPFYNRAKQSLEKLSHVPLSLERGEHINEATMHLQQCLYILQKEQGLQPPLDRLARFLKEPLKYKRFLLEADCYDFFSRQKGFQGIKFLLHETLSQMLALPKEDFEAGHVTSGKLFSIKNITRSMMLQEALLGASCSRTLDLCMFFAEEEDADAYAEVVEELRGLLQVKIELRKGLHLSIATQDFSSLNEIEAFWAKKLSALAQKACWPPEDELCTEELRNKVETALKTMGISLSEGQYLQEILIQYSLKELRNKNAKHEKKFAALLAKNHEEGFEKRLLAFLVERFEEEGVESFSRVSRLPPRRYPLLGEMVKVFIDCDQYALASMLVSYLPDVQQRLQCTRLCSNSIRAREFELQNILLLSERDEEEPLSAGEEALRRERFTQLIQGSY